MATAAVTAEDVALELVATKLAIASFIEEATGQDYTNLGQRDWAYETPVPLPGDDETTDRLTRRSEEIGVSIMESLGRYLVDRAAKLRGAL